MRRMETPPCWSGDTFGPCTLCALAVRHSLSMYGLKNDFRSLEDGPTLQLIPDSQKTTPSISYFSISAITFHIFVSRIAPTEKELIWQYIHLQTPSGRTEAKLPTFGTDALSTWDCWYSKLPLTTLASSEAICLSKDHSAISS